MAPDEAPVEADETEAESAEHAWSEVGEHTPAT